MTAQVKDFVFLKTCHFVSFPTFKTTHKVWDSLKKIVGIFTVGWVILNVLRTIFAAYENHYVYIFWKAYLNNFIILFSKESTLLVFENILKL